jgi:hypothetical protein
MLNVVLVIVVLLIVVMLSAFKLIVITLNAVILSVIMLKISTLRVIILSTIMQNVVMLSAFMFNVVDISVKRHSVECRHTECRFAPRSTTTIRQIFICCKIRESGENLNEEILKNDRFKKSFLPFYYFFRDVLHSAKRSRAGACQPEAVSTR